MKILLSPAKKISQSPFEVENPSQPVFLTEAEKLNAVLKKKSAKNLQELMKISPSLAKLNLERNLSWTSTPTNDQGIYPAFHFDGEVYKTLGYKDLDQNAQSYLDQNLFILSGLYGLLKPKDLVYPYRLEMGTKLKNGKNQNLYEFWKPKLTKHLNQQIEKDEPILNLASKEYFSAVDLKALKRPVVECHFKEFKNGKHQNVMVFFKQARGAMANFCAQNNIQNLEETKAFAWGGYCFNPNLSDSTNFVFTR
ncbi:MAG: peroxide stress protein YaaA [Flavobacteriaceae bacterium]|nr:MAG: peroxide stress protein YaaA [Flavobacteriaceae bacterium]